MYFARTNDILKDTICLKHQVLWGIDLNIFADKSMDKRQLSKTTIEQLRDGCHYLFESRLFDEYGMEYTIARVSIGVLTNAPTGIRTIAYIHRKEQVVDDSLPINYQLDTLRLLRTDCR